MNAVWVPTLAAVKSAQILAASPLNSRSTTYLALLLVQARGGVLDLLTADDRLVQQIDLLAVLRAGDQRQVRVVVAGQHVVLAAAGGLELQRQDLDRLVAALAQLASRPRCAAPAGTSSVGPRAARAGSPGPGGGAGGGVGVGVGSARAGRPAAAGTGAAAAPGGCAGGRAAGTRARRHVPAPAPGGSRAAPGGIRGSRRAAARDAPGGAAWRGPFLAAAAPAAGHRVDHRPDVQPRRLAEVAGLAAVVAGHGDDEVVAVDDDLGPRHAETVDAGADDLSAPGSARRGWAASRPGCARSA